jgi:hypothetical protein
MIPFEFVTQYDLYNHELALMMHAHELHMIYQII